MPPRRGEGMTGTRGPACPPRTAAPWSCHHPQPQPATPGDNTPSFFANSIAPSPPPTSRSFVLGCACGRSTLTPPARRRALIATKKPKTKPRSSPAPLDRPRSFRDDARPPPERRTAVGGRARETRSSPSMPVTTHGRAWFADLHFASLDIGRTAGTGGRQRPSGLLPAPQ